MNDPTKPLGLIETRFKRDPDAFLSGLAYALLAALFFGLWRESLCAGLFVFCVIWPINLAVSA